MLEQIKRHRADQQFGHETLENYVRLASPPHATVPHLVDPGSPTNTASRDYQTTSLLEGGREGGREREQSKT